MVDDVPPPLEARLLECIGQGLADADAGRVYTTEQVRRALEERRRRRRERDGGER